MTKQSLWVVTNVVSFRGLDVVDGEVSLSDSEYIDILDEIYDDVDICGTKYSAGSALESIDPVAFRCGKNDYESEIQGDLEEQLSRADDSDIEWEIDPTDVEEDSEEV